MQPVALLRSRLRNVCQSSSPASQLAAVILVFSNRDSLTSSAAKGSWEFKP
ncbi:MAG: hypothetical protein ACI9F9_001010 [Candidatus Paceibacteria bacterium]|jgi:hypothetical protein